MPKPDAKPQKPQPVVTLKITPGPISNYQRACSKKWWSARIAEVKQSEAKRG